MDCRNWRTRAESYRHFVSWFSAKLVLLYMFLLPIPPRPFQYDEKKPSKTVSKTNPFLQQTSVAERSILSVRRHDCDACLRDAT